MTALAIDEAGLSRVLSEWSGVGNLYRALAEIAAGRVDREWSSDDIARRASRILLLEVSPLLRDLPRTSRAWMDHLPTFTQRHRYWSPRPETKVDWRKTRMRGWPPESFAIRKRHRSSDQLTLSVLGWTLGRLDRAVVASTALVGPKGEGVEQLPRDVELILATCLPLLDLLDQSDETRPSRDDLAAVRGLGWPWKTVAAVAEVLLSLERGGAEAMAQRLLRPDGLPDLLFQLSLLGTIITVAEETGASVKSLRPIGYMTQGPVYEIVTASGTQWDLWCEAAACWDGYGATDVYRTLARGLTSATGAPFGARNIRPDVLLATRHRHALVFECKFPYETLDPGYVAHGLYQAALYASQLRAVFDRTAGYSVGPEELVGSTRVRRLRGVPLGLTSPLGVRSLVREVLSE